MKNKKRRKKKGDLDGDDSYSFSDSDENSMSSQVTGARRRQIEEWILIEQMHFNKQKIMS